MSGAGLSIRSSLIASVPVQYSHPLEFLLQVPFPSTRFAFSWLLLSTGEEEGRLQVFSSSAARGDPCRGHTHILSPLDVMKAIIKENMGLDLSKNGTLGSPIHEKGFIDGQTPFPECLDGSDAHVPATASCHQVGPNGGFLLAEFLAYLPQVHGKGFHGTLQTYQDT